MKTGLKIFVFTVVTLAFYTYVGLSVPQIITYPPVTTDLSGDMTPAELALAGEEIVAGKGTCLACHTVGSEDDMLRFPDLGGIGAIAASRIDSLTAIEYLAQSLYDPDVYIVDGFLPGMPAADQPPIGLSDAEIIAVIAFLQRLGGQPSVTLETRLPYASATVAGLVVPTAEHSNVESGLDGAAVYAAYLCSSCHTLDVPTSLVGPSLYDVGARLSKAEIYEGVVDPDATVSGEFPGVVMRTTLEAAGFYSNVSQVELRALVDYLAAQTGN